TAYLKANYPAEYMAGVLTRSMDTTSDVARFMEECKVMRLQVLPPDVNESALGFTVNPKGEIRYGLGGITGIGEKAVEAIIEARKKGGPFTDIFNFVERVNLQACNKSTIENLAYAGAFDGFKTGYREQYFVHDGDKWVLNDAILRYGTKYQADLEFATNSLFGGTESIEIARPKLEDVPRWDTLFRLKREYDMIGIYISEHPLDQHKFEITYLCRNTTTQMSDISQLAGRNITLGGMVTSTRRGISKNGNEYGIMTITDYQGSYDVVLYKKNLAQYQKFLMENIFVQVVGRVQERGSDSKHFVAKPDGEKVWEFRLTNILDIAEDDLARRVNKITLTIPLSEIKHDLIEELEEQIVQNSGSTTLFIRVVDNNGRHVLFMSQKYRIHISQSFFRFLELKQSHQALDFKIE
ncbi:MAG: DNA polymerase III subunit alpha, partial [Paludibacteraceae bacterium]|nr:DNA polymerase III subunit alpha [Paludibacteraceae bacterium]